MIHTDNTQLMDKALKLIQTGEWVNHGNLATKVGSIPGSFLTAITALPMMVYFSPWSAMIVLVLFHVISYLLLRKAGVGLSSTFSPLVLVIVYWLNPWRVEQSELYNPGYIFLFGALHLYTTLNMSKKSFWFTFFNVICIGFCFQVHFSFLILALCSLILFLLRQIKINWWGFLAGTAVVVLSLLPYLIDRMGGSEAGVNFSRDDAYLGRNLVLVYPVLKAIVYLFRMGSVYFGRHIFSEIRFDWISDGATQVVISTLFHAVKWVLATVSLLGSFYLLGTFVKSFYKNFHFKTELIESPELRFEWYLFFLLVSAVIASALSPVEFNHWHLVLCFPAIALFFTWKFSGGYAQKIKKPYVIAAASIFIVWNIFASFGSRSHAFNNNYERDFFIHYNIQTAQ